MSFLNLKHLKPTRMNELHLRYKAETGKPATSREVAAEESEFIPKYYLLEKSELKSYLTSGDYLTIPNKGYVEWLEENLATARFRLAELEDELEKIELTTVISLQSEIENLKNQIAWKITP
jgi:hypothetical protein